jgi:hypothetical protein
VSCPRLVAREAELALLRRDLAAAVGGRGGMVFVTGEPGVGKSRLVVDFAAEARGVGAMVLTGRAQPEPAGVAYRPIAEALLGAMRESGIPGNSELAPVVAGVADGSCWDYAGSLGGRTEPASAGRGADSPDAVVGPQRTGLGGAAAGPAGRPAANPTAATFNATPSSTSSRRNGAVQSVNGAFLVQPTMPRRSGHFSRVDRDTAS